MTCVPRRATCVALAWLAASAACGRVGFQNHDWDGADVDARESTDSDVEDVDGMTTADAQLMIDANAPMPDNAMRISDDDLMSSQLVHLAWTGSGFGLAWQDARHGEDEIYAAVLAADGTKLSADVRVTAAAGASSAPTIDASSAGFGLAWTDARTGTAAIYFARLDGVGNKQGGDVLVSASPAAAQAGKVVWRGSEFGVWWNDDRMSTRELTFARVSSAGTKLSVDLGVTAAAGAAWRADAIWNGSVYGVVFEDAGDVWFALVDANGVAQGAPTRLTASQNAGDPALTWTGTTWGAAWDEDRGQGRDIRFALLDVAGNVQTTRQVTQVTSPSRRPDIYWHAGDGFGIVWQDDRNGNSDIYFALLSATGVILQDDIRLTNGGSKSHWPSLAHNGSRWAVAWHDNRTGDNEIWFLLH